MSAPPRFRYKQFDELNSFFSANGYAIVSDAFSSTEMADFRADLRNIINSYLIKAGLDEINSAGDDVYTLGLQNLESADHEHVASVYDTIFQSPSFFRIVGNRDVERTIKLLMGLSDDHALYGFTNRCLMAPPTDERRTYGWHQEVFYTVPRARYLQTWAPLIFDTTVENGTIEICPGSHKEGIAKQQWNDVPGRATQIIIDDNVIKKYEPLKVEMKVGELLIFSGYLAHKSGRNASNQVRYSLVGMYHDVKFKPFRTPKLAFNFRGESPREFFDATQHQST